MTTTKSKSNAVIVFLKDPVPGEVKTRIGQTLGMDNAAIIYRKLVEKTKEVLIDFPADIWMFVNKSPERFQPWREDNCYIDIQSDGDLGNKMLHAFHKIQDRYEYTVLIGTDCPQLDSDILWSAFEALENHHLVLGPAHDGGYYLIGSKCIHPDLFNDIPWSSEVVLQKTLEKAKQLKLSVVQLQQLRDVDDINDVHFFEGEGIMFK